MNKMGEEEKITFKLSLIITCLISFPIIIFIYVMLSGFFTMEIMSIFRLEPIEIMGKLTFIFSITILGLHGASSILLLAGTNKKNQERVKVGFGLGLPSWICSIITNILVIIVIMVVEREMNDHLISLIASYMQGYNVGPIYEQYPNIPSGLSSPAPVDRMIVPTFNSSVPEFFLNIPEKLPTNPFTSESSTPRRALMFL